LSLNVFPALEWSTVYESHPAKRVCVIALQNDVCHMSQWCCSSDGDEAISKDSRGHGGVELGQWWPWSAWTCWLTR